MGYLFLSFEDNKNRNHVVHKILCNYLLSCCVHTE
jgi:hypothetical protein